jgi:hypothetical protein
MGLPQHILKLKIGAPMTSSQHLNPLTLCNGTREVVKQLYNFVIEAKRLLAIQQEEATTITGHTAGANVFMRRIPTVPLDYPFKLR